MTHHRGTNSQNSRDTVIDPPKAFTRLAAMLVHRTYISSIEPGKVSMGIEVAHTLACALGVETQ